MRHGILVISALLAAIQLGGCAADAGGGFVDSDPLTNGESRINCNVGAVSGAMSCAPSYGTTPKVGDKVTLRIGAEDRNIDSVTLFQADACACDGVPASTCNGQGPTLLKDKSYVSAEYVMYWFYPPVSGTYTVGVAFADGTSSLTQFTVANGLTYDAEFACEWDPGPYDDTTFETVPNAVANSACASFGWWCERDLSDPMVTFEEAPLTGRLLFCPVAGFALESMSRTCGVRCDPRPWILDETEIWSQSQADACIDAAAETCGDLIDNDADGEIDEGCSGSS